VQEVTTDIEEALVKE